MNKKTNTHAVDKTRQGRKRVALILFALALLAGSSFLYTSQLMAKEGETAPAAPARPPMPVETTEVRVAESNRVLAAVGTLRSAESTMIVAEIAGRIETISFTEGGESKAGKVLFKLDSAVLQAELDRAVTSRDLSAANYQRAENLIKDNAISGMERDAAYAQWQLSEASVRLYQAQLAKTSIHSPFAGTLGLRQVSLGDYVQPGQQLVNLEAIEQLKVEFKIPEKYLAEVKVGQPLTLKTDAYPGRDFSGQVYALDPRIEEESRSLVVRGLLSNRDRALLPGQFVKVQLSVASKSGALFIPEQALIPQPNALLVYKVVDSKALMVPVQIGSRIKGWVEITSGLDSGDIVITGGHQKIGPGSPVHAMPADPALFAKIDETIESRM